MRGVQAYACSAFHTTCTGIVPVDVGGFAHLWCPGCRVLARLEAVAPKFATAELACASGPATAYVPVRTQTNHPLGVSNGG